MEHHRKEPRLGTLVPAATEEIMVRATAGGRGLQAGDTHGPGLAEAREAC